MHFEDRFPACLVRKIDHYAPVKAPRPQQRLIQYVGLVGCGQHDYALPTGDPPLRGKNLFKILLFSTKTAESNLATRAADRIDLVDEYNCRCMFARLPE